MSLKFRLLCAVLCALLAMYTSFSYAQSVRSDAQKLVMMQSLHTVEM